MDPEYLSPLQNFIVNTSKTKINDTSFILSIWTNGCHSKYPINVASMEHIHKYYTEPYKIKQLIAHHFPLQIIKILKENNNKFKLLCNGYIRQLNTKYIPTDVINLINKTCIVTCFADLQNAGLNILTNIVNSDVLTTKQIKDLYDCGIIDILMKSVHKTSFPIISHITWSLRNIANKLTDQNSISIFKNQICECIKIIRIKYSEISSVPLPSLEELKQSNVVRLLSILSDQNTYPILQYEALWSILNITACDSDYIRFITSSKLFVKTLISLLKTSNYQIKEQALWALGNIAGDGGQLKDMLLNNDILENILPICNSKFDKNCVTNFYKLNIINRNPKWLFFNLLSVCAWTVSNLCRVSAPSNIDYLYDLITCLQCLFRQSLLIDDNIRGGFHNHNGLNSKDIGKKNEIIMDIARGFSYLTNFDEYNSDVIKRMDELGIIKQFINLMCHKYGQIRHPINRLIGNILTGSDEYALKCLDLGVLAKYSYILTSMHNVSDREQREICWSLSNVCATNNFRAQLLVMKHGLFKILINYLQSKKYEISKEALWAITNASCKWDASWAISNEKIVNHLMENGVSNALMSFLKRYDALAKYTTKNKLLLVAMECVENILIAGSNMNNMNKFLNLFEKCGIVKFLRDLQTDEERTKYMIDKDKVHKKCVDIVNKYFHADEIKDNNNRKSQ